jgi:hypothetical protein
MMASSYGHEAVCALLLDKGADMEARRNLTECVRVYMSLCDLVSMCIAVDTHITYSSPPSPYGTTGWNDSPDDGL